MVSKGGLNIELTPKKSTSSCCESLVNIMKMLPHTVLIMIKPKFYQNVFIIGKRDGVIQNNFKISFFNKNGGKSGDPWVVGQNMARGTPEGGPRHMCRYRPPPP